MVLEGQLAHGIIRELLVEALVDAPHLLEHGAGPTGQVWTINIRTTARFTYTYRQIMYT
jgi:hypothetical protein